MPTCCAPAPPCAPSHVPCIAVLRPACASRDIRLSLVSTTPSPDRLVGDGFWLRQALGNLLGNAVKFTKGFRDPARHPGGIAGPEGPMRAVLPSHRHRQASPRTNRNASSRLQQGLRRPDSGDQHETGGPGSIARNIARRFGGDLTLSSTPGMGSVFTFTALFRLAADSDGLPETPASLGPRPPPRPA